MIIIAFYKSEFMLLNNNTHRVDTTTHAMVGGRKENGVRLKVK